MPPLPTVRPAAPFVPQAGVVQQTAYNPQLGSPDLTGGANPRALADAAARQDQTGMSTPMYDLPPGRQMSIPGGLGTEGTYPVYDMPRGGYRNPAYDQLNQGDQGYNADQMRNDYRGLGPASTGASAGNYSPGYDLPHTPGSGYGHVMGQPTQGDYNADQMRAGLPQGWQDAMATNVPPSNISWQGGAQPSEWELQASAAADRSRINEVGGGSYAGSGYQDPETAYRQQEAGLNQRIQDYLSQNPGALQNPQQRAYLASQQQEFGQANQPARDLIRQRQMAQQYGQQGPQAVDAQMWARNRDGYGPPAGGRAASGAGAQLYGGDPAWADLAGVLGHDVTQQIYGAGQEMGQSPGYMAAPPVAQAGAVQQNVYNPGAYARTPSWSGWQGGVNSPPPPPQQQLAQAPAQQQSSGRPWWQNYDLGTLAKMPSEQLQQLPPEVLDAMPNEFYTQHPEFMGRFTGQQMGQRGFAPEFQQQWQGGQPGQNVQPGNWLPTYQQMLQTNQVPDVVQAALKPMQSGGYESQNTEGSTPKGEGLSPFMVRPLGGIRPMDQGRYASLDPTSKQALGGTLGYMGNFNQGQDYTAQAGRQGQGGPNVSIGQAAQAPQQRF